MDSREEEEGGGEGEEAGARLALPGTARMSAGRRGHWPVRKVGTTVHHTARTSALTPSEPRRPRRWAA